jgi:hypothetical protein
MGKKRGTAADRVWAHAARNKTTFDRSLYKLGRDEPCHRPGARGCVKQAVRLGKKVFKHNKIAARVLSKKVRKVGRRIGKKLRKVF